VVQRGATVPGDTSQKTLPPLEPAAALEIRQYQGDARLLRIEQLLDPLLGLSTTESVDTQDLREEYRRLRDNPQRTPAEEQRFRQVTALVSALPAAQAISPEEKDRLALLARVERLLAAKP
jgi:hypothetical protein